MALKYIGGIGIALGLLLLLAAFAQPATVTEASTSCVDTAYYGQDCATVEYERPNHTRSQLFGGGVFLLLSGLVTYGIGTARGERPSGPSSPGPSSADADAADGRETGAKTLRDQLDEETNRRRTADAERAGWDDPTDTGDGFAAPTPDSSPASTRTPSDRHRSTALKLIASGLATAFVLTWLLGGAVVVESVVGRAVVFALCSLPGIGLYGRYAFDASATEGSDR